MLNSWKIYSHNIPSLLVDQFMARDSWTQYGPGFPLWMTPIFEQSTSKPLYPVGFPVILPSGGLGEWYEAGKLLQAFVGSDLDFI